LYYCAPHPGSARSHFQPFMAIKTTICQIGHPALGCHVALCNRKSRDYHPVIASSSGFSMYRLAGRTPRNTWAVTIHATHAETTTIAETLHRCTHFSASILISSGVASTAVSS
jgi:hypothetical protein